MKSKLENADFYDRNDVIRICERSFSPDFMKCDFFDPEVIEARRLELLSSGLLLHPQGDVHRNDIRDWQRNRPPSQCISPRDGSILEETRDTVFLAALLQRSKNTKSVLEYMHGGDSNLRAYVPEFSELIKEEEFRFQRKIPVSEILTLFISLYFDFRKALASTKPAGMSFLIGNMVLRPEDSTGDEAYWKFVGSLEHPFSKDGDPLSGEFPLQWHQSTGGSLSENSFFCPLDGPIQPITAYSFSPEWTWKARCGRAVKDYLCPKCFGQLDHTWALMN